MSNYHRYKVVFVYLICLLPILHSGCTFTANVVVHDIGEFPKPLVQPLPLNVGFYCTDEFKNYKTTEKCSLPDSPISAIINIELGNANVQLFNYLLGHTFESITILDKFPNDTESVKLIDIIIEPNIVKYAYDCTTIIIEYEIKIISVNGNQFDSWRLHTRNNPQKDWYGLGQSKRCGGVTKEAMRDIATKYFIGFRDHVGIIEKSKSDYDR